MEDVYLCFVQENNYQPNAPEDLQSNRLLLFKHEVNGQDQKHESVEVGIVTLMGFLGKRVG